MPHPLALTIALATGIGAAAAIATALLLYRDELELAYDDVAQNLYARHGVVLPGWSAANGGYEPGFGSHSHPRHGANGGGGGGAFRHRQGSGATYNTDRPFSAGRAARLTPAEDGLHRAPRQPSPSPSPAGARSSAWHSGDGGLRARRTETGDIELEDHDYASLLQDVRERPENAVQDVDVDVDGRLNSALLLSRAESGLSEQEELDLATAASVASFAQEERLREDSAIALQLLEDEMRSANFDCTADLIDTSDNDNDNDSDNEHRQRIDHDDDYRPASTDTADAAAAGAVRSLAESVHTVRSGEMAQLVDVDLANPFASEEDALFEAQDGWSASSTTSPLHTATDTAAADNGTVGVAMATGSDGVSEFTTSDDEEADYRDAVLSPSLRSASDGSDVGRAEARL